MKRFGQFINLNEMAACKVFNEGLPPYQGLRVKCQRMRDNGS